MLNVTVKTLQNWDNANKLIAYRNPQGRRFYTHEQYEAYMGIQKENKVGKIVIYGRVLSAGQKEYLANQLSFLRDFANARGLIVDDVFSCRIYGLRKYQKKIQEDEKFEENL